ncbi:hypothetical protein CYY_001584 [Polysphondylium violaceum]|uniref:Anoctamin transmembrane domain-containing protein n=1 Tax=Polysphondylium violaceum TaxID=133409 RepID=A0A8J4Q1S0_9MYCE|nr:hypothetical protein CYY_001584 [Polysphondylium violaceum]
MSDRQSIPLEFYQPEGSGGSPNGAQQQQQIPYNQQQPQYLVQTDASMMDFEVPTNYIHYADLNFKQKFMEDMLGATVRAKKAKVPPGFTVSYTKHGQPFLQSTELEKLDPDDVRAAEEHTQYNLKITCSNQEVERVYGAGIYLYFNFILFCIGINFILFLGVLINMVPHYYYGVRANHFKDYTIQEYILKSLNLQSYYQEEAKLFYFWSTFACIIISFLMGPIYAFKINYYFRKNQTHDFEDGFEVDDEITKNLKISHKSRIFRFIVSYTVFGLLIGVSAVCTVFVLKAVNEYRFLTNILTTSFISAVIIRVINVIYEFFCMYLTRFEKHRTWTNFRNHNTLKLFVFKIINVIVLYILRDRIFRNITNEEISPGCPFVDVGSQLLFILVLDLTIQNIWEIIYSVVWARIGKMFEKKGKKGTDYYKPEFDLADEYIEILYRQFIVYLGLPIFPIVTLFGIVCNFVEYYVDRFRLFKICKRPHRLQGSMKKFLSFYLLIISVVCVVTYPYGSGWVLIQIGFDKGYLSENCPLFEGYPNATTVTI